MTTAYRTILYPTRDLEASKSLFRELLGVEPHVDQPFYVGFSVNGNEVGLIPSGHDQGMVGPEPFFDADDLDATIRSLQALGATVVQEPTNVGGGTLIAKVVDTDGNVIGLRHGPSGS